MQNKQPRNPGLATILSFFIPGLGQMYNGQIGKGIAILFIVWPFFLLVAFSLARMTQGISFAIVPLVWIAQIIDAKKEAEKSNDND